MLLLTLFTLGLYPRVWFLRRRSALNRLDSTRKLRAGPLWTMIGLWVLDLAISASTVGLDVYDADYSDAQWIRLLLQVTTAVLYIYQTFAVRQILNDHLAAATDQRAPVLAEASQVHPVMAFFFSVFYLQHAINRDDIQPRWS